MYRIYRITPLYESIWGIIYVLWNHGGDLLLRRPSASVVMLG